MTDQMPPNPNAGQGVVRTGFDPARGIPAPGTAGSEIRPDRNFDMDGKPLGPREAQVIAEADARHDADLATRTPDDPNMNLYDIHTGAKLQTREEQLLAEAAAQKERDRATR